MFFGQTDRLTYRQTGRLTLWFIGKLHFQKCHPSFPGPCRCIGRMCAAATNAQETKCSKDLFWDQNTQTSLADSQVLWEKILGIV